jgi:hypothetical protein
MKLPMDQPKNPIEPGPKPRLSLNHLSQIVDFLKSQNLEIWVTITEWGIEGVKEHLRQEPYSEVSLVADGLNGIRASYDRGRDRLEISFHNGFEEPHHPVRQAVESWLSENFDMSR